jgi:molybdenum-dependent DNA-binding transcriptional regulator ModE
MLAVGDRRGFERRGVRQATTFGKRLIARVFAGEKAAPIANREQAWQTLEVMQEITRQRNASVAQVALN